MHGADYHDTLGDFFSPAILPPEYGGEGPAIEEVCQDWTNQLLKSEQLLQKIATHPTGDIAMAADDCLISEEADNEQFSEGWCMDITHCLAAICSQLDHWLLLDLLGGLKRFSAQISWTLDYGVYMIFVHWSRPLVNQFNWEKQEWTIILWKFWQILQHESLFQLEWWLTSHFHWQKVMMPMWCLWSLMSWPNKHVPLHPENV